jgi:hypothetical protein
VKEWNCSRKTSDRSRSMGGETLPPILIEVSVYRLYVEQRVIPKSEVWCERQGFSIREDLSKVLESISEGPAEPC